MIMESILDEFGVRLVGGETAGSGRVEVGLFTVQNNPTLLHIYL